MRFCVLYWGAVCSFRAPSLHLTFLSSRQVLRPYALVQHLIRSDGGSTHHGGTGRRLSERGGGDQSEELQRGVWACRVSCARCAVLFNAVCVHKHSPPSHACDSRDTAHAYAARPSQALGTEVGRTARAWCSRVLVSCC